MSDHIVLTYLKHVSTISNMRPEYVKVQKHCINQSFLVTIQYTIAQAISLTKGVVMKTVLDGERVIMEKA
jgi:hypothetical protein